MSSFYSSLRFLSNEGCKSYRPLHPQSLTPLPLFPPSHLKVNEACWGSCHSQHNVSTYPRFHPRVFPRNHDVYSVLSEYTRHILCIIWVYTTYTLYYLSIHDVYPRFHPNAYPIVAYPCILILRYSLSHPTHHSDILIIVSSVPWLIQS